jgi:hypothetical protein
MAHPTDMAAAASCSMLTEHMSDFGFELLGIPAGLLLIVGTVAALFWMVS